MKEYYDKTENKIPNKNLRYFIEKIKPTPASAIELGCGAGRDTVYLIKNGWNVLAIDRLDVEKRISKRLTEDEQNRFRFSRQRFEEVKLEKTDLIVANFSLSFCDKGKFGELWNKIQESIVHGRLFCGKFLWS